VLVLIENHYVEPVDRQRILEGAVKGMVAELDPHSAYLPPSDFRDFQNETEGSFVGVGVEVDARQDAITVIAPIEGSPAERAGVRPGDRIIAVDGWPTRGQPLERVVHKMRGAPGTTVRVTLQRPGVDRTIDLVLTRAKIHVDSVTATRLDGDIGYVRVKQFQRGTHDEFVRAMATLRTASDATLGGIVLDLRTNPGGLVNEAAALADELLEQGTIYTTRARGRVVEEVRSHAGGAASKLPLAVIVNEYTASAAELVAGAVQDQKRGVIVGTTTFGKGSVQSIVELPDGAGLKLTTMLYFTPNGRSIQAQGIVPDVQVGPGAAASAGAAVFRERDIDGHLPAPEAPDGGAGTNGTQTRDSGIATGTDPMIERDVPRDPTKGRDLVLSIAYQLVRGVLVKSRRADP
jgi:carboxyl-terminal processing protease